MDKQLIEEANDLIEESVLLAGALLVGAVPLAILYAKARKAIYFKKVFGNESELVKTIDKEIFDNISAISDAGASRVALKTRNRFIDALQNGVGYVRKDDVKAIPKIRQDTLSYFDTIRHILKKAGMEPPALKAETEELRGIWNLESKNK